MMLQSATLTPADTAVGYEKPNSAVLDRYIAGFGQIEAEWGCVYW